MHFTVSVDFIIGSFTHQNILIRIQNLAINFISMHVCLLNPNWNWSDITRCVGLRKIVNIVTMTFTMKSSNNWLRQLT